MRRAHFAAIFGIAHLAASYVATPSLAQNLQPTGLPVRGAVQGTDVIVDQPSGSSTVRGAQASAIATYVQSNLNLIGGLTGDCAATGPGTVAITCTKSSGTAFGTFAFQNFATLPSASGSPPISAGTVFPCIPSTALDGCTGTQLAAYVNNGPIGADPTGNADSTSALQSWLNAGAPGKIPCGVYKTTAMLTEELALQNGLQVSGSGSGSIPLKTGGCYTVIRPTSAVTRAFLIDGTPFGGFIQGVGLQDLVFDLTNLSDISTSVAINQVQAFDVMYDRVRVINDGVNKRAWLFSAGAYTTTLLNTQGNILDFEGASSSNGVTTIMVINHDGFQVITNWANSLKFIGGAYQGAGLHFGLTNTADVEISTDVEGSGTYLAISNASFIRSYAALGGMAPGFTEMTGVCNFNCVIWDTSANSYNYVTGLTTGEITLNNAGSGLNNNRSSFLSGSLTQDQYLWIGRTAGESMYGVAGNANDLIGGTVAGDTVVGAYNTGESTWVIAAGVAVAKLTGTTFTIQSGVTLYANQASFNSGSLTADEVVLFGYQGVNAGRICAIAVANSCFGSEAVGDLSIGNYTVGGHLVLGAAGSPQRTYDGGGHEYILGYPQPTAGSGTATVSGNDSLFVATAGSSVTSSAVNFSTGGTGWASTPSCLVSGNVTTAFPAVTSVSTGAVTIGWSASVSGAQATVRCARHN
jgi:hypothetical protein